MIGTFVIPEPMLFPTLLLEKCGSDQVDVIIREVSK
jgi:hypothetical protein